MKSGAKFCKRAGVAKQHIWLSQEPAPAYKGPETAGVTDALEHVLLGLCGARMRQPSDLWQFWSARSETRG